MAQERSEILRNCRAQLEAQLEECSAAEQAYLDRYLAAAVQHPQDLNNSDDKAAAEHECLRQRCSFLSKFARSPVLCLKQKSDGCWRKGEVGST